MSNHPKKVRVGLVQMKCSADLQENLQKAVQRVREAAEKGAQIVCLQELFTSQYFCQIEDHKYFGFAEEIPGPTTDLLCRLAAELEVVIVASLVFALLVFAMDKSLSTVLDFVYNLLA